MILIDNPVNFIYKTDIPGFFFIFPPARAGPPFFCISGARGAIKLIDKKSRLVVFLLALIHTNKIVTTEAPNIAEICRPVSRNQHDYT